MSQERWNAIDAFFESKLLPEDSALEETLKASESAGLAAIAVSPLQGRLLHLLALSISARRILEIGTLGGYSAICMARALPPEGTLVTLEIDARAAEVAASNIARAGLRDRVSIRLGPALETLPTLEAPFDLAFIDADKPSNPSYFEWALKLVRPGGLIIVDNVVRDGAVADPESRDPAVLGVRQLVERIASEPSVTATAAQTVGVKGWDGFLLARVVSP